MRKWKDVTSWVDVSASTNHPQTKVVNRIVGYTLEDMLKDDRLIATLVR